MINEKIWGYNWTLAANAYYKIKQNYDSDLELIISQSPYWSYEYALNILKLPFILGETAIANSDMSIPYAENIIKGRFKLLELNLTNNSLLFHYIQIIMKFNHE